MDYKLLVLIAFASYCCAVELQCPQECKCRASRLNKIFATCTTIDPTVQFQSEVNHLVIVNQHHDNGLVLSDRIFIDANLRELETIRITNSSLKEVHFNAFHGLKKLSHVDLSNNNLTTIDADTFLNNKKLKHVVLNGNPIQMKPKQKSFLNSESILELLLVNCNIGHIPPGVFASLKNLEFLDLRNNKLTEINADTFGMMINLESIDLGDNSISKIDKDAFADIDDLTVLSLRGNKIKTIEGIDIETLKELDLSDCQFTTLLADTFAGFPDIYTLNLSGNAITDINKDTFTDLSSLRYLDLSRNNIQGPLDPFLFEFNRQLETISFAGNNDLFSFPGFQTEFSSLYNLDLSGCGLTSLTPNSFKGMPFIDTLNISGNHLGHIPPKAFYSIPHLTVLDISRNKLFGLNNKIFFNNPHLHKLYVSHNNFNLLPAILFSGTPTLSVLDMSYNHIYRLWNISESYVMKNRNILSKLIYLNTAGNRLKSLHMHSFISMRNLETLDISNNPIVCTQDFSHVMQWLIGKKVVPSLEMRRDPESLNLINNNIQWEEILNEMCPLEHESKNNAYKTQSLVNQLKIHAAKNREREEIKITENPEMIETGPYTITPLPDESNLVWPMVLIWISILSIILAVGNLVAFFIYRSRRNYGSTTYTPAPSLSGHFLVRRGGRSVYKKLYADCSEPAQVHTNNPSKIITILGFSQNSKLNSNV